MKPSFFKILVFLVCLNQTNVYGDNQFLSLKDFQKRCIADFSNVLTEEDKNSNRCKLNDATGLELKDHVIEDSEAYLFKLFGEKPSVSAGEKEVLKFATNGTGYVRSKFYVFCKALTTEGVYRQNTVRCYQNLTKHPGKVTALDATGYLNLPDSDN